MGSLNPCFNVNKLALYGAIIVLLGDFVTLLVAYQQYCDSLNDKTNNSQIQVDQQGQRSLRLRREFGPS